MQLLAFNKQGQLIGARQASKQENYFCVECQGTVRRRAGPQRQPHFFHLRESTSCFLSGKSMTHIQIQSRIWTLLPPGECELEYRFPEIGRIADLVWFSQKLIFEVQCSSISASEIEKRNQDYSILGFRVIWILHDSLYNKRRLTEAEIGLTKQPEPYFFSNIDEEGVGEIYDQFDLKKGWNRLSKLSPLFVDLSQPKRDGNLLYFVGDLKDLQLQGNSLYLQQIRSSKKSLTIAFWKRLAHSMSSLYKILFQTLLERACK